MSDYITTNYQGAKITVAVTGLPITITGEVIIGETGVLTLKLADGKIVNINESLIAFFF